MIYEFDDSKAWLKAELEKRASSNPLFSGNAFAKKIGLSQSYLSLILTDKRSLTEKSARIISKSLKLSPPEIDYLTLLVKKENSKDSSVKKHYNDELQKFRHQNQVDEINLEKFKVISDWHHSALLELITLKNVVHTDRAFAKRLSLDIPTVREALKRLEQLELIKKENNKYVRNDKGNLATPTDISHEGLRNFHRQILKKAISAVDEQSVEQRVFSGMTMSIDVDKLPEAKKLIENFKNEMSNLLEVETKTKVYQISIQLFQLDKDIEDKNETH
jgi:uncharacterized protein (TIGR02147 family)